MPYTTTTITSASTGGPGTAIALSWQSGKPTSVSVIATSISSATFSIQFTLDDIMRVASTSVLWQGISSGIGTTVPSTSIAAIVYNASNAYPDGLFYSFLGPIAAVRMTVTGTSVVGGPLTMKVLQGEIG